jgi:hypothetical protein
MNRTSQWYPVEAMSVGLKTIATGVERNADVSSKLPLYLDFAKLTRAASVLAYC